MRTWLVLGAVLAVTLAAVADALHGGRATVSKVKPVEHTSGSRIVPPGAPSGFMGTVYYSDSQDGCRVKTLAIPGFESTKPPDSRSCRFSLSPDGESVVPGDAVWKPQGGLVAHSRRVGLRAGLARLEPDDPDRRANTGVQAQRNAHLRSRR